ncbi:hypothetical protein NZD89_16735 [Alicyclobacillus fastidiosus]|uniref:NurA domain-containing protein n=1 Tax=Alicyclobacillus fastidiosus TaxID=392011 RepID=A0ABY6ZAW9_9BACL|nr:hypothetical protein [Alicyclobacillus fastidiosus]WAH40035.1 hypothetical protein NZD89_16735 [Alicyclobacillus fastidiosus]GMA61337.1 hypothetical protein GCM10025859_17770 [Alicyclobacillus fastidiosus]
MSNERKKNSENSSKTLSLFDEGTMHELLMEDLMLESMDEPQTTNKLKAANSETDDTDVAPTLGEWKRLYEAAIEFRDLAAWNLLYEDQLFGVVNPEDGEVGYCSVMGASGEFHAIAIYRGGEGLLSYERMKRQGDDAKHDGLGDPDVFLGQKALMASFEGSKDVDRRDREVFKALGLRFRGNHAWPILRSYEPGCVPWFLNAKECRFLTHALEQTITVIQRVKENPNLFDERPGCILTRTTMNSDQTSEWVDQWLTWSSLEDEINDTPIMYPSVEVDEMRLKRAMRSGRSSGVWEVDIFYAPFSVHDGAGERPYFPRLMLCVHHSSGMILSAHPADRDAEASEFVEQFVSTIEQHEVYPDQIVVRQQSVAELFYTIADVIDAELLVADFLPGIEMVREEMLGFMG